MKKILVSSAVGFFLLIGGKAFSAEQTFLQISTITWRVIAVSSTTATKVDSFAGGGESTMTVRNEIEVWNVSPSTDVYCGFDSTVSTVSTNAKGGFKLSDTTESVPNSKRTLPLGGGVDLWCQSESLAGGGAGTAFVYIEQRSWKRP